MRIRRSIIFAILALSVAVYSGGPKWAGKLVKDNVTAEGRLKICGQAQKKDAFTPQYTRERLYVTGTQDYSLKMQQLKESIINDKEMNEAQKESTLNDLDAKAAWVDNGYLVYHLRLFEPKLLKMQDFRFAMTDADGHDVLQQVFTLRNNEYVVSGPSPYTIYNYFWVLKFAKPFTKKNYPGKSYPCRVIYPNGEDVVFEIYPQ